MLKIETMLPIRCYISGCEELNMAPRSGLSQVSLSQSSVLEEHLCCNPHINSIGQHHQPPPWEPPEDIRGCPEGSSQEMSTPRPYGI